jgi:protein TonB
VQVTDVINIVEDDVDIDDNLDIFDSEFREDVAVKIVTFQEEEEEIEEEQVFVVVEDMPGFGGGDSNKFREYIAKNLRYPEVAAENGIQGRVFVQFVVEPDGRVSNVKVVRGVDPALDKEAVRVVESSPPWKPGKQRGKPVRVSFTFPIIFVLQ